MKTMERGGMCMSAMNGMAMGHPMDMRAPMMGTNAPMNMMMMPRCTMKMEQRKDGMALMCAGVDAVASGMMQNLCAMLVNGMVSCAMMMNGMVMMNCNFTMGMCACEMTGDGMCVTCTSGDTKCLSMITDMCACMMSMMKAGCSCCLMMNGTPVACGCSC